MIYGSWFRNKLEETIPGYKEFQKYDKGEGLYVTKTNGETLLVKIVLSNSFTRNKTIAKVFGKKTTLLEGYAFDECSSLTTVNFPNVTSVGNYCFNACSNLNSLSLPKASFIGEGVFANCYSLISVSLPSVEHIGAGGFNNCTSLKSISVPRVYTLNSRCFFGCISLETLDISRAEQFESYCFSGCKRLFKIICKRGMKNRIRDSLNRDGVSQNLQIIEV